MSEVRVLYVEDDAEDFETYSDLLRSRGWKVDRAVNSPDALKKLKSARAATNPYRVILIDRILNEKDALPHTWEAEWGRPATAGDLLLARVREEAPEICPVMLTTLDDVEAARQLTHNGALDYLVKGGSRTEPTTFGDDLDERCRVAILEQTLATLRHSLLARKSLRDLLSTVFLLIRDTFETTGSEFNLFYADVVPGQAVQIYSDQKNDLPLWSKYQKVVPDSKTELLLVNPLESMGQVLKSRLKSWSKSLCVRDESQTLTEEAEEQLIYPVLVVHPQAERPLPVGLLMMEARCPSTRSPSDLRWFEAFAQLVADYLAAHNWCRHEVVNEVESEHKRLLAEIGQKMCGPLQNSQSNLELLALRLQQGDVPDSPALLAKVKETLQALDQSVFASEHLRIQTADVPLEPKVIDLRELVRRSLDRVASNLAPAGIALEAEQLDAVGPVPCRLDPERFVYVLEGLMRNAWEAVLRKSPRQATGGEPTHKLSVRIDLDPEAKRTARLVLQDDGPGFLSTTLEQFGRGTRLMSQKGLPHQLRKGLGLFECSRFVERSEGRMEIENAAEVGAVVRLIFPLFEKKV